MQATTAIFLVDFTSVVVRPSKRWVEKKVLWFRSIFEMSESDREHALDETLKFSELVFEHECVLRQTIIGTLETHFGKVIDNIRSEE